MCQTSLSLSLSLSLSFSVALSLPFSLSFSLVVSHCPTSRPTRPTAKLEDIGYGIQKLIMSLIVEDSGFGQDDITDLLYSFWGEDGSKAEKIQSIEVPTMSKV